MRRARALFERWTAWSPALLLAALAALTFWLDAQVQAPDTSQRGDLRHDPDIFITNFRAVSFDATGKIKQSLTAQRAQHHPDDESVDFVSPQLILTDPARPKLTVRSDAGTLSGDHETMLFRGHVNAVREAFAATPAQGADTGPMTLTTDLLRVLPNKGIAETDRPVTIQEARGIIQGVGITLDNQARTMKMKSGVRGSFQPESPK
jgi:lipopolysaccharide export system protein LptC